MNGQRQRELYEQTMGRAQPATPAHVHLWTVVRAWWGGDVKLCKRCGLLWIARRR